MGNYQISAGTLLEEFETIGDWTVTGGSANVDTSIFKTGSGSLKLTSGSGTNCIATKTINVDLSAGGVVYLWMYVGGNLADLLSAQVILSNDSSFTDFFSKTFTGSLHEGWNKIAIGKSQWTTNGSATWSSNMIRLRVRVNANASVIPIVYFDSMYYGFWARPKVVIGFDDGWASQIDAGYPILAALGLKATCYIIQDRIGTAGYMTTGNLSTLHTAGWDMNNHTKSHIDMTAYTQSQAEAEVISCANYLAGLGFTRKNEHLHVAYPFGGYNANVLLGMATQGMITARTIIDRTQSHEIDSQYLLSRQYHDYTMSAATYKNFIKRTIADGGSLHLNYHKIVSDGTGAAATEVEVSQFQDMMNYIAELSQAGVIDAVTFTDWYRGLTNPRKLA